MGLGLGLGVGLDLGVGGFRVGVGMVEFVDFISDVYQCTLFGEKNSVTDAKKSVVLL